MEGDTRPARRMVSSRVSPRWYLIRWVTPFKRTTTFSGASSGWQSGGFKSCSCMSPKGSGRRCIDGRADEQLRDVGSRWKRHDKQDSGRHILRLHGALFPDVLVYEFAVVWVSDSFRDLGCGGPGLDDADATEDAFATKVTWIKQAAGDRFPALELNTLVQAVIITDDPNGAARTLSAEWKLTVEQLLVSPLLLIGSVEEIATTLRRRREQLGISSITVFEKDLDTFAKVIERITR